jgi:hypothetical protein
MFSSFCDNLPIVWRSNEHVSSISSISGRLLETFENDQVRQDGARMAGDLWAKKNIKDETELRIEEGSLFVIAHSCLFLLRDTVHHFPLAGPAIARKTERGRERKKERKLSAITHASLCNVRILPLAR